MVALSSLDINKQACVLRGTSSPVTTMESYPLYFFEHVYSTWCLLVPSNTEALLAALSLLWRESPENRANRQKFRAKRITKRGSWSPDQSVPETYITSPFLGYVNHSTASINCPIWTGFSVPCNSKQPNTPSCKAEWITEQRIVQKHHRCSSDLTQTSNSLGARALTGLGHPTSQRLTESLVLNKYFFFLRCWG